MPLFGESVLDKVVSQHCPLVSTVFSRISMCSGPILAATTFRDIPIGWGMLGITSAFALMLLERKLLSDENRKLHGAQLTTLNKLHSLSTHHQTPSRATNNIVLRSTMFYKPYFIV